MIGSNFTVYKTYKHYNSKLDWLRAIKSKSPDITKVQMMTTAGKSGYNLYSELLNDTQKKIQHSGLRSWTSLDDSGLQMLNDISA
ncbi:MAG: hypothetical protein LBP35_02940 [Candidatus Ancillula trichonymphae]|nr:hypothetical protein [Candidatus Ancillula trichonymphae]